MAVAHGDMIEFMKKALCFAIAATFLACSPAPAQQAAGDVGGAHRRPGDHHQGARRSLARSDPAGHAGSDAEAVRRAAQCARGARRRVADRRGGEGQGAEPGGVGRGRGQRARVKPVDRRRRRRVLPGATSARCRGASLDVMAPGHPPLSSSEQQARAARQALLTELRKGGPAVRVLFEAPRHEVEVAATTRRSDRRRRRSRIVEFSDFQCPFCQRVAPTLKQVQRDLRRQGAHRLEGLSADADPPARRSRPARRRTAPATRASSGSTTTGCSATSRRCRPTT